MLARAIYTIQRGNSDVPPVVKPGEIADFNEQEIKDLLGNSAIELVDEPELALTQVVVVDPVVPVVDNETDIIIGNVDESDEVIPAPVVEEVVDTVPESQILANAVGIVPAADFDREKLEARAIELSVEFRSNISDAKLAERVAEAEKAKGEPLV